MIFCLAIDADWAPREVTDHVLGLLYDRGVPFTFFATPDQHVRSDELCEVALHPNFTEGRDPRCEMETLARLFPQAIGIRPHRLDLGESSKVDLFREFGMRWLSASLRDDPELPRPEFSTFPNYPIDWGDNLLFRRGQLPTLQQGEDQTGRPYLLNFHPFNVFINTHTLEHFTTAKEHYADPAMLRMHQCANGCGVRDILLQVLELAKDGRHHFCKISDINNEDREAPNP